MQVIIPRKVVMAQRMRAWCRSEIVVLLSTRWKTEFMVLQHLADYTDIEPTHRFPPAGCSSRQLSSRHFFGKANATAFCCHQPDCGPGLRSERSLLPATAEKIIFQQIRWFLPEPAIKAYLKFNEPDYLHRVRDRGPVLRALPGAHPLLLR